MKKDFWEQRWLHTNSLPRPRERIGAGNPPLFLRIQVGLQLCPHLLTTGGRPVFLERRQVVDGAGSSHDLEDEIVDIVAQRGLVLRVVRGSRHEREVGWHEDFRMLLAEVDGDRVESQPLGGGLADAARPLPFVCLGIGGIGHGVFFLHLSLLSAYMLKKAGLGSTHLCTKYNFSAAARQYLFQNFFSRGLPLPQATPRRFYFPNKSECVPVSTRVSVRIPLFFL